MVDPKNSVLEPNNEVLHAVCNECGTVQGESFDHQLCSCGGVYHVDSARCLQCGGRHSFSSVGQQCNCGGEIVPKMASCPICKGNTHIEHLGENCIKCNIPLRMEG